MQTTESTRRQHRNIFWWSLSIALVALLIALLVPWFTPVTIKLPGKVVTIHTSTGAGPFFTFDGREFPPQGFGYESTDRITTSTEVIPAGADRTLRLGRFYYWVRQEEQVNRLRSH